jgi:hypothetical protein
MNIIKKRYKLIFVFLFSFLFIGSVFALSLYQANQISKDYVFENEYVDGSTNIINCKDNKYYVSSILNYNSEILLFVVLDQNGELYTKGNLNKIIETAYVYKKINKESESNYLSLQLIDRIDNIVTILESNNAKLQGVINSNYSNEITSRTIKTKEDLQDLIYTLKDLSENLSNLYTLQQNFINNLDCDQTYNLINKLNNSFEGYDQLTQKALDYKNSANSIIEVIISNDNIDDSQKSILINYVTPISNLSQQINTIYESISKTNSFYNPIVSEILKTDNTVIDQYVENIKSREDRVLANNLLYDYDSVYDASLDYTINYILSDQVYDFWKDQEELKNLENNYKEITTLINNNQYDLVISKIKLANIQAEKILDSGFVETQKDGVNYTTYYYIIGISVLLIILLIYLNKRNKSKKRFKRKVSKISSENIINNNEDPF